MQARGSCGTIAPYVVVGWLGGIVTNLVIISAARGGHASVFWDVTLHGFGLLLAALALARLAAIYAPDPFRHGEDHVGVERKSAGAAAPARAVREVKRP